MDNSRKQSVTVGVDIGGTFTDFVFLLPGSSRLETLKLPSTPNNPAHAVIEGLNYILKLAEKNDIQSPIHLYLTHGSTVATNALLERRGARCALITTKGFRDILEIGRQNRRVLYDLLEPPVTPLIPRERRFEITERILHTGEILTPLDADEAALLVENLSTESVESVAICLLFSFIYPDHENRIADLLASRGYFVSKSSEVLPEYREYERTVATVINAYVSPILDEYLSYLKESVNKLPLSATVNIMQSNGGVIGLDEATRVGVKCILSGPAGGVSGAHYVARLARQSLWRSPLVDREEDLRVITFDMGGTSTDVSLIDGTPTITMETEISGYPLRMPMLAIHTVGAGGGSIAWIDPGGVLRVGPRSAGADPGPACYARGFPENDQPTVTDANLILGRILSDFFLGGRMPLDKSRAFRAFERLGATLGLDAIQVALGVLEIINSHMERALRVISLEKGYDPSEFTMISFGGAGGLHAVDLAVRLGIPRIIIPRHASTLSAFGMIVSDIVKDYSQTVMIPGESDIADIQEALTKLVTVAQKEFRDEGFSPDRQVVKEYLDIRYKGQSYELTIPFSADYVKDFHTTHEKLYGYHRKSASIEIVNVRVRAIGLVTPPDIPRMPEGSSDPSHTFIGVHEVHLDGELTPIPFFNADSLLPGNQIVGPAILLRSDTTILLMTDFHAYVDGYQNLIISKH